MSGFDPTGNTVVLDFQGGPYDGAEVVCSRDMSVGTALWFEQQAGAEGMELAAVAALMQRFGDDFLIRWNVKIKGRDIPATGEGMLEIPTEFANAIVTQWKAAAVGVPDPLASGSTNGASTATLQIPRRARRAASRQN